MCMKVEYYLVNDDQFACIFVLCKMYQCICQLKRMETKMLREEQQANGFDLCLLYFVFRCRRFKHPDSGFPFDGRKTAEMMLWSAKQEQDDLLQLSIVPNTKCHRFWQCSMDSPWIPVNFRHSNERLSVPWHSPNANRILLTHLIHWFLLFYKLLPLAIHTNWSIESHPTFQKTERNMGELIHVTSVLVVSLLCAPSFSNSSRFRSRKFMVFTKRWYPKYANPTVPTTVRPMSAVTVPLCRRS